LFRKVVYASHKARLFLDYLFQLYAPQSFYLDLQALVGLADLPHLHQGANLEQVASLRLIPLRPRTALRYHNQASVGFHSLVESLHRAWPSDSQVDYSPGENYYVLEGE
jgi:hypothetical protein